MMTTLRAVIFGLAMAGICLAVTTSHPWLTFVPAIFLYLSLRDPKVLRARLHKR